MYKFIIYLLLLSSILYAKPLYTFGNISINHLNWSNSTEDKTNHKDFNYIEIPKLYIYNKLGVSRSVLAPTTSLTY